MSGSQQTLSEHDSKALLAAHGLPFAPERRVGSARDAVEAAVALGLPVAVKLGGDSIAHKTERGLVRLDLASADAVETAALELLAAARADDGEVHLLVAPMVRATRELIVGGFVDPQFGPMVMLGVGGVLAELHADAVFRPVPLDEDGARAMQDALRTHAIWGPFRGESAVDRDAVTRALLGVSRLMVDRADVVSVDVNPMMVRADGSVMAVDALVEIGSRASIRPEDGARRRRISRDKFMALFEPRGVVVTGASTHPGKFGFVSLHNILASGYRGAVHGTNLQGEEVLGIRTVADVGALPDGDIDMAFVCTPASANPDLLRACAVKGVKAAFLTSAGYGEAGEDGRRLESELVELCDDLGILMVGPNGQGVVSTPANLCAQIVAPYPPRGRIAIASQSGNFVSSFMNYSRHHGVGISRAVSAGNAAMVGIADFIEFFSDDPETAVSLAYVEGITDGHSLMERLGEAARSKPVVLVKGGSTEQGARAAASHTGALAANDRVFDGWCQARGVTRAATVEEAFEAAATFASQPLPAGPNVVVLTTAGGWGVVTSDAIAGDGTLRLMSLPDDLRAAIDEHLPPRWSRNNPVDCAGGETRDTIPTVLDLIVAHPDVHSVIYLGIGIQSNQARLMREGGFHPDHGLERIVEYHERQDARFAESAAELSDVHRKPVLVASELAIADRDNPGVAAVRASGRLCYPSGNRAVSALGHLYRYARFTGHAH